MTACVDSASPGRSLRGEDVGFIDHDERGMPERLRQVHDRFKEQPDKAAALGKFQIVEVDHRRRRQLDQLAREQGRAAHLARDFAAFPGEQEIELLAQRHELAFGIQDDRLDMGTGTLGQQAQEVAFAAARVGVDEHATVNQSQQVERLAVRDPQFRHGQYSLGFFSRVISPQNSPGLIMNAPVPCISSTV